MGRTKETWSYCPLWPISPPAWNRKLRMEQPEIVHVEAYMSVLQQVGEVITQFKIFKINDEVTCFDAYLWPTIIVMQQN